MKCAEQSWNVFVGELSETADVEGVTAAASGKVLTQHSAFMRLHGVAYGKKHACAGQIVIFGKTPVKEVKAMKATVRHDR